MTLDANGIAQDYGSDELRRAFDRATEPRDEADNQQRRLILSGDAFLADFHPPDYLIDGVVQRRFLYSLTAKTGTGKTAICLLLSALVGQGIHLPSHDIERGKVLYLAGENPDDVRMRWITMGHAMGFDPKAIDVHFIPGVISIHQSMPRIQNELERLGELALVIVDTSMAYFDADDSNANPQMLDHAKMLRELTTLPGKPCVIAACHPSKDASVLVPYGGGAFLNEMDGNLTLKNDNGHVVMHWHGKHRGPDFAPLHFKLETVRTDKVHDSKGRPIPCIVAEPLTSMAVTDMEVLARRDEDAVLIYLAKNPRASMSAIAEGLGWFMRDGTTPYKSRVQRALDNLKSDKLVKMARNAHELTKDGKKEAEKLEAEA